jgi:hypothetical protein
MLDISFLNLDQQLLLDDLSWTDLSWNGGEGVVQPCVYLITTFFRNFADRGESKTAALNVIVPGDLLTTVEITSNLLGNFRFEGDV